MLDWALRYVASGWPVFPLRGKKPLVEHGLSEASLNEAQVRAWWAKWPTANIGVVMGGDKFAVDIDPKHDGYETWESLRLRYGGTMPDTLEQETGGGGRHIIYAMPEGYTVRNSVGDQGAGIGQGIDIRGEGGYLVAAPSIHPETRRAYEWDLREPWNWKPAAAPAWLLKLIQEAGRRPATTESRLPEKIAKGARNDKLFRVGASLRARGFAQEEIFASLQVSNKLRCEPPLDDAELHQIAESIAKRYAAGAFGRGPRPPSAEEEALLGKADIEAAVDHAIATNDLLGAMRLVEHVVKLPPAEELLAKTKLRKHFAKDWRAGDFDEALKRLRSEKDGSARSKVVEMPAPPPDGSGPTGPANGGPDLVNGITLTESGNALRIIRMFGAKLLYCTEMKKFLVWDGRRWEVDERRYAVQLAIQMAKELYRQAGLIENDRDLREAVGKWARRSESRAVINATLDIASTMPGMPCSAEELDQHQYLLNCLNGVIDLRTGDLVEHDQNYKITKLCHVDYDPKAKCDRFIKFILWAMGDNPEAEPTAKTARLVAFLQRAFGYALTGDVSEKCVFVFWGDRGDNGKTTLLNVFSKLLKEYAAQIDINTLMASKMLDAAMRADLASLRGARFVTTSEVENGSQLGESKLKYITAGMGKIKTCRKYENPIEFEQTHKLFMDANYRPKVRGTDDAIWQRLKPVPFTVKIDRNSDEFDRNLIDKLTAESAGVLAWAVRGCIKRCEEGLGLPPEITDANAEWRDADDPLREFLEECCEVDNELWVQVSSLTQVYVWWCQENRERPLGRVAFAERMKSKSFGYSRSRRDSVGKQLRTWEHVGLRPGIELEISTSGSGRQRGFDQS
jgi:P4 family phage/plasmid primase-like protien